MVAGETLSFTYVIPPQPSQPAADSMIAQISITLLYVTPWMNAVNSLEASWRRENIAGRSTHQSKPLKVESNFSERRSLVLSSSHSLAGSGNADEPHLKPVCLRSPTANADATILETQSSPVDENSLSVLLSLKK